jgi:DNA polymerase III subunit delta'
MADQPRLDPALRLPWHFQAWQQLSASSDRDQMAHALLIHGEGGLHKVHLGRQIAQGLLCEKPLQAFPCGRCRGCTLFVSGNHPDWAEVCPVDSAVVKVDQIRDLSSRLAMRPQIARRQVALIWPAEQMNSAASNALLKTLEEPSGDTHLLLVADRVGRLSATIRSRCQRLPLVGRTDQENVALLARLAAVDEIRARAALVLSGGDPELALDSLNAESWAAISSLAQQLLALARAELAPAAFAASYRKDAVRLLQSWSRLIALMLGSETSGHAAFDALLDLTSAVEISTLLPLATQLERARGMIGSGVREDLLVFDLAARWSQAFTTRGRRREA